LKAPGVEVGHGKWWKSLQIAVSISDTFFHPTARQLTLPNFKENEIHKEKSRGERIRKWGSAQDIQCLPSRSSKGDNGKSREDIIQWWHLKNQNLLMLVHTHTYTHTHTHSPRHSTVDLSQVKCWVKAHPLLNVPEKPKHSPHHVSGCFLSRQCIVVEDRGHNYLTQIIGMSRIESASSLC
jgi:hypothetical protein